MFRQNVTNKTSFFNFHLIHLQMNFSIHLEIRPSNDNVSYLMIYQFDAPPQLSNLMENIDGWDVLCHTDEYGMFSYFLDNNQTLNHHSIYVGIRELREKDKQRLCVVNQSLDSPMIDQMITFSSNYDIRIYSSACFYLNQNNIWQSDGLLVSFSTNIFHSSSIFFTRLDHWQIIIKHNVYRHIWQHSQVLWSFYHHLLITSWKMILSLGQQCGWIWFILESISVIFIRQWRKVELAFFLFHCGSLMYDIDWSWMRSTNQRKTKDLILTFLYLFMPSACAFAFCWCGEVMLSK